MKKAFLKRLRIFSALVAVVIMAVIFVLSSQNGEASDNASISLTVFLFSSDFDFALLINFLVRKIAHMIEFGVLAVPVYLFATTFRISESLKCIYSVFFTMLYGVSDEIHQYFVEGRSCQLDDVIIDSVGAFIAVLAVHSLFIYLRSRNRKKPAETGKVLLELFSEYIGGDYKKHKLSEEILISSLMEKAYHHKIIPLIASALSESKMIPEKSDTFRFFKSESVRQVYIQTRKTRKFLEVYKEMTEAGAKPLCIKGIICRQYYPEPDFRPSSDEDIIVSDDDYPICIDILKKNGFKEEKVGEFESCFKHSQSGCMIELHSKLFPRAYEIYKDFNRLFENIFDSRETVEYEGVTLYTMSPDENILYLILHAFKHFIFSGVGIRQVCDISLFAKNNEINWKFVGEKCDEIGAKGFLNGVLIIGSRYFGLELEKIRNELDGFNEKLNVDNMLEDLLSGGIYGSESVDRLHSGTMTFKKYSSARNDEKVSALFPPLKKMNKKYPYLDKYPFLLPFAWIMRFASYTASEHNSSKALEIGKKRIELMKELNII